MIKVVNATKKFDNEIVFKNINFEIKDREKLLIIGPSGAGKTTLLRCFNKLDTLTSGRILIDKINVNDIKNHVLRRKVGLVFQNYNLFDHLNVKDNIMLSPSILKKQNKKELSNEVDELLERFNLSDKKKEYPKTLSGGEKQRVAIARMIINNHDILMFDEPTSSLDPEFIKMFIGILNELSKTKTIIVVSHEMSFIDSFADKVLFLAEGKVIEFGTPKQIKKSKCEIVKSFLEIDTK